MKNGNEIAHKQSLKRLPFAYYYVPFVIFSIIGFTASTYLAVSHYRIHSDLSYSSFCALSRALNCDTVSSSPYAVFMNLPLAIWGAIGYLSVIFLLILAGSQPAQKKRLWPIIFWVSLLYCIGSLVLSGISSLLIHSYCIMCIITYLVNFSLLYWAWFVNRRFGNTGLLKGGIHDVKFLWEIRHTSIPMLVGILFLTGSLIVGMPEYWHLKPSPLNESLPRGNTEDGYPWIGAENPELTINEFSDYMCFQCKKMHFFLRQIVAQHPNRIRLVHRHFPMDRFYNPLVTDDYHTGAGKIALLALYAQAKGQFWEVNDLLFDIAIKKQDFNTSTIAEYMGVEKNEIAAALKSKGLRLRLKHDISVGINRGITGTPGFIIGDKVYLGTIPEGILKKMISENEK